MRHCREDYEAIQPWPTKRPHFAKDALDKTFLVPDEMADNDALNPIIPEDEPVFVIRAQDAVGPEVVRYWADTAASAGADPSLCRRVHAFAEEMERYADEHGSKTPDTPPAYLKG